jgi:hypothetical protein
MSRQATFTGPRTKAAALVGSVVVLLLTAQLTSAAEPQRVNGWILNDLGAAQKEARTSGKPIFVTIRCEA